MILILKIFSIWTIPFLAWFVYSDAKKAGIGYSYWQCVSNIWYQWFEF